MFFKRDQIPDFKRLSDEELSRSLSNGLDRDFHRTFIGSCALVAGGLCCGGLGAFTILALGFSAGAMLCAAGLGTVAGMLTAGKFLGATLDGLRGESHAEKGRHRRSGLPDPAQIHPQQTTGPEP